MADDDDGHEIPAPGGGIRAGENREKKGKRKARKSFSSRRDQSFLETLVSNHNAYKASTMIFDQPGYRRWFQLSKAHPDQVPVGPVHGKGGERMRTGPLDVERSRKKKPELVLMIGEAFPRVLSPGEWMWMWKLKAASTSIYSVTHAVAVACSHQSQFSLYLIILHLFCALAVDDVMEYLSTFNNSQLSIPHDPDTFSMIQLAS
ncbi:hypothetical protein ASPBRDRAFT_675644 [Aspergillus brasiliensis CBS 101740]|uniref:Uncharacterized protein n=1 Tax=Aspergillus brasiliensis (strain CBS 101740 / IMI 381727 / IBT 21946) TaxID=767769 RepID=A0A1L9UH28_ASPBC|nr:hypothetical protein ASPBRDRAFT_675644 [Aspergillus brasiliensis CBS 101740]